MRVPEGGPPVLVAAHPDDEVIGAGAFLAGCPRALVVHVTDGSPRDLGDARALGFCTREAYARARREEADRALALAGLDLSQVLAVGVVDQEAIGAVVEVVNRLRELLVPQAPALLLTHPYEGGHPDHDATALAAHALLALWPDARRPELWELTSYHAADDGGVEHGCFLPSQDPDLGEEVNDLDESARALKERMLAAFTTQQKVLAEFPLGPERFRRAPRYRFTEPPHPGLLNYERHAWGATGAEWREQAARALATLGLAPEEPL
jgi:LmbE family N-acetylglucosaminyl deacetylase